MRVPSALSVPLFISSLDHPGSPSRITSGRRREPIRIGVPVAKGAYDGRGALAVLAPDGSPLPTQTRVLDRWSDGSARWVLVDFEATPSAEEWECRLGQVPSDVPETAARLILEATPPSVRVNTGAATFDLRPGGAFPFAAVTLAGGESPLDGPACILDARAPSGARGRAVIAKIEIEDQGPLRATVLLTGGVDGLAHPLNFDCRLTFFAGSAAVRLDLTLRNPEAAAHPGGRWDLGDPGSVLFERCSLHLPFRAGFAPRAAFSIAPGAPIEEAGGTLEIYQDSSGGERWNSSSHLNRKHEISTKFRGYRVRAAGTERKSTDGGGHRATPVVTVSGQHGEVSATIVGFWQNFPKAIEVSDRALDLHLFPPQSPDGHELQAGEQKTQTLFLAVGPDAIAGTPLEWARTPLACRSTPDYYCSTGVVPYLTPATAEQDPGYLRLVSSAIEGDDAFERKREVIDEYGWRHFGDVYGDHEAVFHKGPAPLISHWNNQYDTVAGAGYQFLRTADPRWLRMMTEMAAHVADIDVYHTDKDKSAYNHGLFWHTAHYVDADTATHRTYPGRAKVSGGGPAAGHLYATGLGLTYFLTGNEVARRAAIELAQFVIDSDDGRKSPFRFLAGGYTGNASASAWDNYHGPGRGSANGLNTALDGYRITGRPEFLAKAEQLVRRCIHPTEDISRHKLHDVEIRWFYTMFLQVLGRYLDVKAEAGAFDHMYRYGRESLLHYARWMLANEQPYLDKADILEYPTETWAAQDMRKSDIFFHAARHADPPERERFRERAEFFFRYVVDTLDTMPTKSLCRPVAILMSSGYIRNWFVLHPEDAAPVLPPAAGEDFGSPLVFVPQKVKAMKRAKALVAAGAVTAVMLLVAGLILFLT